MTVLKNKNHKQWKQAQARISVSPLASRISGLVPQGRLLFLETLSQVYGCPQKQEPQAMETSTSEDLCVPPRQQDIRVSSPREGCSCGPRFWRKCLSQKTIHAYPGASKTMDRTTASVDVKSCEGRRRRRVEF